MNIKDMSEQQARDAGILAEWSVCQTRIVLTAEYESAKAALREINAGRDIAVTRYREINAERDIAVTRYRAAIDALARHKLTKVSE